MQLSIRGLRYRRGSFTLAVDELDLPSGKHFIMGPNGSGKTTLMKTVCGIFYPDSGSIMLDNVPSENKRSWERHVAYIPQDLLLFPGMSVEKNLLFPVRHANGSMEIFHEMVESMKLKDLLQRRSDQISGGQAQRVALARAIISSPSLLLMDEPLSMQDQSARIWILSRLDDLMKKYFFSIIYVTHDQSDLDFGFDSVTFMDAGRVIEKVSSLSDVNKATSVSMLHYGNMVKIGGKYFLAVDDSISFSDSGGYVYRWWKSVSYNVLLASIEGEEYFIRTSKTPDAKYLALNPGLLKPLQHGS
ncbi:MAG: ABC transporter ATP-binding protein [Candidatus Thermoplasmatota archaeon]|nr:ABC transporter ATP-binding protein [Candidatus Thermoplasmatota archaeon]